MTDDDNKLAAQAERLQQRRTRLLWASGLMFMIWMAGAVGRNANLTPGALRVVDIVRIVGMLAWGAVLLRLLVNGGLLPKSGAVRDILEDELTLSHRRNALMSGFWALLAGVTALYVGSLFVQLTYDAVAPALLMLAVAVPALRFAFLEWRASRSGQDG